MLTLLRVALGDAWLREPRESQEEWTSDDVVAGRSRSLDHPSIQRPATPSTAGPVASRF